jgi:hypothetical protein
MAIGAAAALAAAAALPDPALAHGLVGKQDLPIPRWLFAWAAAIVLVASFVGLAALWQRPMLERPDDRPVLRVPAFLEPLAGALGVAAFCFLVYAGFAGSQTATANIVPTVIYVIFWVGVPFATLLVGDVFRPFNPWRAAARGVAWLARRVGPDGGPEPLPYPARLGYVPAALGIVAFAWVELVYVNRDDPSTLAILMLAYAAVQLVGMSLYGIEKWSAKGDAFSVAFGLYSRLSPLHWRGRTLEVRPPVRGVPGWETGFGAGFLLCAMIGTTSFDGFSNGQIWSGANGLALHIQRTFLHLHFTQEGALEAAYTVGLVAMVALIYCAFRLGIMGMSTVGRGHSEAELARRFVHTLIPISLAYVAAHYFSLLAYQGQAMAYLVSDPLGHGSNIFGTASATIDYGIITATGVWYVQVGALIVGHVAGLVLAHDRALAIYDRPREATRSQYWMLAVMIGFTSLGLWILSEAA